MNELASWIIRELTVGSVVLNGGIIDGITAFSINLQSNFIRREDGETKCRIDLPGFLGPISYRNTSPN